MGELLTSGKMAELNCVSKKTLRLYREMGLLKPVQVDEVTGYCLSPLRAFTLKVMFLSG